MKRTEIRAFIKAYLTENNVTTLSPKVAEALAEHLGEKLPNELSGNGYNIECEFEDFFTSGDFISGKIER